IYPPARVVSAAPAHSEPVPGPQKNVAASRDLRPLRPLNGRNRTVRYATTRPRNAADRAQPGVPPRSAALPGQAQHVRHDLLPHPAGEDRLGVELDRPPPRLSILDRHD